MGFRDFFESIFVLRYRPLVKSNISLTDTAAWSLFTHDRKDTRIGNTTESPLLAYRSHELVFACINKIADVMNDAEIVVEERNAKGEWQKKDSHLLSSMFSRPNDSQTGRDLRRLMIQSEQTTGRVCIVLERSKAGIPIGMTVLNPIRVVEKYTRDRTAIDHYEYLASNGSRIVVKKEDMLIRRRADLLDQFRGFAPAEAALRSINSDLGFSDYVNAFFESDGTPSGILRILNQTVPDDKREALQAQWRRRYSRGGSNQKGLAVLDQNAEYQKIGSNLDELASDSLSGRFESRICSVFGVPPNLVGAYVGLLHVTANATAKSELQNFWLNKISGELAGLREWLTWFLLPEFEDIEAIRNGRIRVGFDVSHVVFLQENVEAIHERSRKNLLAGGWTLNEFREATGQPPDPNGDYYLQPVNLLASSPDDRAAAATQGGYARIEAGKEGKETTDTSEKNGKAETNEKKKRINNESGLDLGYKASLSDDGELVLSREPRGVEAVISLKKIVGDLESDRDAVLKVLASARLSLIDQAARLLDSLTPETAHTLTLVPDERMRKKIRKILENAFKAGREQVKDEMNAQRLHGEQETAEKALRKADGDDDEGEGGESFAEALKRLDELTDGLVSRLINETTTRAVNQYLQLKLLLDYTVEKLKDDLTGQSEKFLSQLAESTVNAAMSKGRDVEIEKNVESGEVSYVMYSAILDRATCGPCSDADGEEASDPSDLPAAPNPDCEGGSNCRCVHIAVAA